MEHQAGQPPTYKKSGKAWEKAGRAKAASLPGSYGDDSDEGPPETTYTNSDSASASESSASESDNSEEDVPYGDPSVSPQPVESPEAPGIELYIELTKPPVQLPSGQPSEPCLPKRKQDDESRKQDDETLPASKRASHTTPHQMSYQTDVQWRYASNFPYTASHELKLRDAHTSMLQLQAAIVCAPELYRMLPFEPKDFAHMAHVDIVKELNETAGFYTTQTKWVRGETFKVHIDCRHCCCYAFPFPQYCRCRDLHEEWVGCCSRCVTCYQLSRDERPPGASSGGAASDTTTERHRERLRAIDKRRRYIGGIIEDQDAQRRRATRNALREKRRAIRMTKWSILDLAIATAQRDSPYPLSSDDRVSWKFPLDDPKADIQWRYAQNFPYTTSHERRLRQAHQKTKEFNAATICAPGIIIFLPHEPKEYALRTHIAIVSELNDTDGFYTTQRKWLRGAPFKIHDNCGHCCCRWSCATCKPLHEDWTGCCSSCELCSMLRTL
jgi:hypothetical protein